MPDDERLTGAGWRRRVYERLAAEGVDAGVPPEIVDEIGEHLAQLYRARVRAGDTAAEAAGRAEEELAGMGPLARAIERRGPRRQPAADAGGWWAGLGSDVRLAIRMIARERGFAGLARLSQASARAIISRVDPLLPVASVQTMEDVIGTSVSWREAPMRLLSAFAGSGLLLASIGVYGVLAYYVSQRTRELGVRAALGATGGQLARLVARQSMVPLGLGLLLGMGGSMASGRALQQLLYDVRPGDPQVLGIVAIVMMLVGVLAGWLPARRAASLDPVLALKED